MAVYTPFLSQRNTKSFALCLYLLVNLLAASIEEYTTQPKDRKIFFFFSPNVHMLADLSPEMTLETKALGWKANLANATDSKAHRHDPIIPRGTHVFALGSAICREVL